MITYVENSTSSPSTNFSHSRSAQGKRRLDIRAGNPMLPILRSSRTIDCVYRY